MLTTVAAMAGTVYFWPRMPGFWRHEIWWEEETAREGMGMMIVVMFLLTAWVARSRGFAPAQSK